jgi:glutamate/tyrosine decarboxylase-like PLP-dependent enzyme
VTTLLDPLAPIAEIVGEHGFKAHYSDVAIDTVNGYRPGWEVSVNAAYGGATLHFSNTAGSLDEAAGKTLAQLKQALGLS